VKAGRVQDPALGLLPSPFEPCPENGELVVLFEDGSSRRTDFREHRAPREKTSFAENIRRRLEFSRHLIRA
jgi:hypothetical protein